MINLIDSNAKIICLETGVEYGKSDLIDSANKFKAILPKKIRSHRSLCIIQSAQTMQFLSSVAAAQDMGFVPMIVSDALPRLALEHLIQHFCAEWALAGTEIIKLTTPNVVHDFFDEDVAFILMSSGTTGLSKGIIFTNSFLEQKVRLLASKYSKSMLCTLNFLPLSFGHGLIANTLAPLYSGGRLYLSPKFNLISGSQLQNTIHKYKIQYFSTVPSMWSLLRESAIRFSRSEKSLTIHCASAALMERDFKYISDQFEGCKFIFHYGMTECGSWITEKHYKLGQENFSFGNVGSALDCHVSIKNITGETSGSIFVQGENFPSKCFFGGGTTFPILDGDGCLETKDCGYFNSENELILTGRYSNFINKGGIKISPLEIEQVVLKLEAIKNAVVIAHNHPILNQVPVLLVEFAEKYEIESLKEYMKLQISAEKIPNKIIIVNEIPITQNGKVDRQKLISIYGK